MSGPPPKAASVRAPPPPIAGNELVCLFDFSYQYAFHIGAVSPLTSSHVLVSNQHPETMARDSTAAPIESSIQQENSPDPINVPLHTAPKLSENALPIPPQNKKPAVLPPPPKLKASVPVPPPCSGPGRIAPPPPPVVSARPTSSLPHRAGVSGGRAVNTAPPPPPPLDD